MRTPAPSTSCAAAVFAAVATLLCTASAGADEPIKATAPRPVIVVAAPQLASTDVDDRAVAVVVAHLQSLDIDVQVVRIATNATDTASVRDGAKKLLDAGAARGALWIDAGREEDVGLYALPRDGTELYGRRVKAPRGKTATALELLAGIAAAAGEELAQGRATGLPKVDVTDSEGAGIGATAGTDARPEGIDAGAGNAATPQKQGSDDAKGLVEAGATERATSADRPMITGNAADVSRGPTPWPMLAFSASYVGGTFGDRVPWQNGASLRASFAPMRGLYLGAGYDVVAPTRSFAGPGAIDLTRHPVFAGGGYRLVLGSRFDLQLGARATVDVAQQDFRLAGGHFGGPRPDGGDPSGGPGGGPVGAPSRSMTSVMVSAAPVAEAFFLVTDQLRMNAMIGVDFSLINSTVSAPPPPPGAPDGGPGGLSPDPIRFIAGLGFEYGVVLPSKAKSVQTASR